MPQRNRVLASKPIGRPPATVALRRGHPVIPGCLFSFSRWRHELSTNDREKRIRVNRMIRISPVRVITAAGEQLGVLPIEEALAAALERGLDLVEVAPTARPPVVKIMDYGKFKFEEAKAARAAKKKERAVGIFPRYRPRRAQRVEDTPSTACPPETSNASRGSKCRR